jgi:hypothetical protein
MSHRASLGVLGVLGALAACCASGGTPGASSGSGGAGNPSGGGGGSSQGGTGANPGAGGTFIPSTGGASTGGGVGLDGGELCGSEAVNAEIEEIITPGDVLIVYDQSQSIGDAAPEPAHPRRGVLSEHHVALVPRAL